MEIIIIIRIIEKIIKIKNYLKVENFIIKMKLIEIKLIKRKNMIINIII